MEIEWLTCNKIIKEWSLRYPILYAWTESQMILNPVIIKNLFYYRNVVKFRQIV